MGINVLSDIAKAEKDAEQNIKDAEVLAEKKVYDAIQKVEDNVQGLKAELTSTFHKEMDKLRVDFEEKKKRELRKTKVSISALTKAANNNKKPAIDYIYTEFLKSIK